MADELSILQERLSNLSNDELLKIVQVDYKDYREDALDMAKNELKKRNIKEDVIHDKKKVTINKSAVDCLKHQTLSKKNRIVLSVAIVTLIVAEFLETPVNATLGYYLVGFIIKLFSYSIVLVTISALVASILNRFKTHTLIIFSWLMVSATFLDFIIVMLKNYLLHSLK